MATKARAIRNIPHERERKALRLAVAEVWRNMGCGCCGSGDKTYEALAKIGKILNVKKYSDGSGYNWAAILEKAKR